MIDKKFDKYQIGNQFYLCLLELDSSSYVSSKTNEEFFDALEDETVQHSGNFLVNLTLIVLSHHFMWT